MEKFFAATIPLGAKKQFFVHPPRRKVMKIDHRGIGERNPQQDPRDTGYPFWVIRVRRENLALERFGPPPEVKSEKKYSPLLTPDFNFPRKPGTDRFHQDFFRRPRKMSPVVKIGKYFRNYLKHTVSLALYFLGLVEGL